MVLVVKRIAVLLVIFTILSPSASHGALLARSAQQQSLTSAAWAVSTVTSNQVVSSTPYILNWSVASGNAYDYFSFRNVGTITLSSFRVAVTQRRLSGSIPANEIFFERCVGGTWSVLTSACSGTTSLIGRASEGVLLFSNLNLSSGSALEMRARTATNNRNAFESSLSVEVSRSDLRQGQVFNS